MNRLNTASTKDQPIILIKGAGHMWDEYGLFANERMATLPPLPIVEAREKMVNFVKAWLDEWKEQHP
jgi:hypothetical protein